MKANVTTGTYINSLQTLMKKNRAMLSFGSVNSLVDSEW